MDNMTKTDLIKIKNPNAGLRGKLPFRTIEKSQRSMASDGEKILKKARKDRDEEHRREIAHLRRENDQLRALVFDIAQRACLSEPEITEILSQVQESSRTGKVWNGPRLYVGKEGVDLHEWLRSLFGTFDGVNVNITPHGVSLSPRFREKSKD